jgi:hypothetical protein
MQKTTQEYSLAFFSRFSKMSLLAMNLGCVCTMTNVRTLRRRRLTARGDKNKVEEGKQPILQVRVTIADVPVTVVVSTRRGEWIKLT